MDIKEILSKRNYRQIIKKNEKLTDAVLTLVMWAGDVDEASYCLKYEIFEEPLCVVCGDKKREFKKRSDGTMLYTNGCCLQHARIATHREKYGVDNPSQLDEFKEKKKQTTLKNYGVAHNSQSEKIKQKKKQTTMMNYGVEVPLQNEDLLNKARQTNLEKYGVESPLQNKQILETTKQTNIEKYGVENPQQHKDVREKTENTCIKKYGGKTPMSSEEVRLKNNNSFVKTFFEKKMNSLKHIVEPMFSMYEYTNSNETYLWKCIKCGQHFQSHLQDGRIPRCYVCYPSQNNGMSMGETEIYNYISVNKKQSDRTVLEGKELDIFLPDNNIAIEFNGVYWHSELNGKDKNYHLNKTKKCGDKNIQLIHIFETEWIEKPYIIKSIINSKLGKFEKRIFARKCQIKEITSKEKNQFLEDNHLQGQDKSSVKLGLFYDNELVSVMTFGNSRYNKKYQWEMHRFCNKLNHQIIGGASKLWTYFIKNHNPTSVITYADRRYSDGTFYEKIGFEKVGESKPNYFYFKGNSGLMSRLQFQKYKLKDKLEDFNPELTEWENMQLNGYDRIWDCGNYTFEWTS